MSWGAPIVTEKEVSSKFIYFVKIKENSILPRISISTLNVLKAIATYIVERHPN